MTLDTDGNPTPHAPHRPTDPPPRAGAQTGAGGVAAPSRTPADAPSQSTDTDDATTARATTRAILAALPAELRALTIAAVLSYVRALASLAAAVREGLARPSALAMADAAARVLVGDATDVHEVDAAPSAPSAPCTAILGAWWGMGPYDLARDAASGSVGPAEFTDAAQLMAELGDGRCLDAPRVAPRIVRCPLPAGVERVDLRGVSYRGTDPYLRAILGAAPRPLALACALTMAPWARTLAALARAGDALAAAAATTPAAELGEEGLTRWVARCNPREFPSAAADAATLAVLHAFDGMDGAAELWRALTAARFAALPAELSTLRRDAVDLDAFADDLDAFAAG